MQKNSLIILVFLIFVSIVLLFNNSFPPVKAFSEISQNIFTSSKEYLYGIKIGIFDDVENKEIEKLKRENQELTKKLIDIENIKLDNEALRSQFESGSTLKYKMLPANVIGYLGKFSYPASLIIDQGNLKGLFPGMAVIVGNQLVGKIGRVSGAYSEVILVNNNNFTGLGISSENNAPGIIVGAADFAVFERVDVSETLTEGETVLTKGEINDKGYGIPPDLIVGKISSINKSETLPFQTAKVESEVQFSKLHKVFVITGL